MKKILTLLSFVFCLLNAKAQQRVKTINDLKYYIGYSNSEIQDIAKKKGYVGYFKDDDEKNGPFTHKLFMGEEYDLEIICDSEKVIGAAGEDFTANDYANILSNLKNNGYTKTIDEKMIVNAGFDRADLWVSSDGKWKVRIDYSVNAKEAPHKVTLTNGLKYGFE